jgi:fibronectin-binding autotransporter adhesin
MYMASREESARRILQTHHSMKKNKQLSFRVSSHAKSLAWSLVLSVAGFSPAVRAASLIWDASGTATTTPTDGAGTWDTSAVHWNNATGTTPTLSNGTVDAAWPNTSADIAVFGNANGTAGIVTVGTVTANGITFKPVTGTSTFYTLATGTITMAGTTPNTTPLITLTANAEISAKISGSDGLKVAGGSKTLTLSGTNDYTGGTTVSTGTLKINTASALQGNTALAGKLYLNAGNTTYPNTITGSGAISVIAATTTGDVVFTGDMHLYTGTLDFAGTAASRLLFTTGSQAMVMASTGTIKVESGTTLCLNEALNYGAKVTLLGFENNQHLGALRLENGAVQTGTVTLTTADSSIGGNTAGTISGVISGAFGLTKQGTGTLTLSVANTYTGATTISAGTLALSGSGTLGTGAGALTLSGGTLDLGTLSRPAGAVSITAAAASGDTIANGSLTGASYAASNTTGTAIVSANLLASGTAGLTMSGGGGTLTLTGTNTYTGATTLSAGTVSAGSSANLGAAASNLVFSGGTLQITGTSLTNFSTIGHTVSFTGNVGLDINDAANTFTVDQLLNQGTGGFTKLGAGTAVLNLANTYTGDTTVQGGKVLITGSSSGSGMVVGNTNGVSAALYQTGAITTSSRGVRIGQAAGSFGYYKLSSGSITMPAGGEVDPGAETGGAGTFGQFDMIAGTVNGGDYLLPNRGAAGEASVTNILGGTFTIPSTVSDNGFNGLAANWASSGTAQTAAITINGSGQFISPTVRVKLNEGSSFNGTSGNSANVTALNLTGGGLLQTLGFLNGTAPNVSINLNNGTLKAGSATNTGFLANLGSVNVYSGNATIDNNGQAITIAQPFLAASGTGVSSVPVTAAGSGYITPPEVTFSGGTITGGSGSGATAYATIDATTGALTGIVVTNPGTYSVAPTTVTLTGGGGSGAALGSISTAANTSGGMAFAGSGTTKLSGANTYTGATTVNAGTLQMNSTNATSASVTVNNGATLALNVGDALGYAASKNVPTITSGGTIRNIMSTGRVTLWNGLTMTGGTLTGTSTGDGNGAYSLSGTVTATSDAGGIAATISGGPVGLQNQNNANGAVTFNVTRGSATPASDLTVSANLIPSFATGNGLTKTGTGIMTLSGANTYTGNTTVNGGTLVLGATGTISTSSGVTIAAGATLDATASTPFAMSASQTVTFMVDGTGTGSSGLLKAATLDITNAHVAFTVVNPLDDTAYVLATYTSLNGTAFATATAPAGYTINYSYNGENQIALVKNADGGYSSWASTHVGGQTPGEDYNNDGVKNGVAYFMGADGTSFTANPGVEGGMVTWPKGADFVGTYGTNYVVQTSSDLVNWADVSVSDPNLSDGIAGTQLVYTLPPGSDKLFVRLVVTP